MLLSAKAINNWCNVNMYTLANQWVVNSGDPLLLYFQIIDTSQSLASLNSSNVFGNLFGSPFTGITAVGATAGLRYLLGIGSSNQPYMVKVTFPSIDPNQQVTITATQADPNDSSLWVVSVPASQAIGGGSVQFAVYEGSSVRRFSVLNMLDVLFPTSNGMC
jgi:hypothetical protein